MGLICTIFCDRCGEDLGDIGEDVGDICGKAASAGWVEEKDEHFCSACWPERAVELEKAIAVAC